MFTKNNIIVRIYKCTCSNMFKTQIFINIIILLILQHYDYLASRFERNNLMFCFLLCTCFAFWFSAKLSLISSVQRNVIMLIVM